MGADVFLDHQNILNAFYNAGYITENEKNDLLYNLRNENHSFPKISTAVNGRELYYSYYDRNRFGILCYSISITVLDDKGQIDFIVFYDTDENKFIEEL